MSHLRIALVSLQHDAEKVPPLGLVSLATYLRERGQIPQENIRLVDRTFLDAEEAIKAFSPDIVGFTSMTVDYGRVVEFARKLRQVYDVPYLIGGVHISSLPQSLDHTFDCGVLGEGEETLRELALLYAQKKRPGPENLKEIKGLVFYHDKKLVTTPPRELIENLDDLPIPDFRFLSKEYFQETEILSTARVGKRIHLISSRGCPYKCLFCSTSHFWERVRFHSPDYTAKMVKRAIEEFGVDNVGFLDDLFPVSPERLNQLRIAFDKYGIMSQIKSVDCTQRSNLMNDRMCEALNHLKISALNFGFESGSEKILGELKCHSTSVEKNKNAIQLCKKHGISVFGSLMYGVPGETIEDMERTNDFIDFAIDQGAKYLWSFVATPFPATPFWETALRRGKVSSDMDWDLLSHHSINNPLLLDEGIDRNEFKKVFLKGRKKLRKMKIQLIKNFVMKNPLKTLQLLIKSPAYYAERISRKVYKQ